jgi:superfamily II DNA or RNA helicase
MENARRIAERLERIAIERPEIVTSDEPGSSAKIAAFSAGSRRWLVSVLMVSEGVDIPRLRVGVYATAARTELFFRQVIGRFVRRTPTPKAQMSYLLLPADTRLKALAAQIEEERNHALEQQAAAEEEQPERERSASDDPFHALSSSAYADDAITSSIHGDDLQLFYEERPSASVSIPAPIATTPAAAPPAPPPPEGLREEPAYARRERLREERNKLVADIYRRTGEQHRQIHARMNRETGAKSVGAATLDQLERANALLVKELRRKL